MSLYKRGNIWSYKFRFQGKRYRGSTKTSNKKLAREYERRVKAEVYRGVALGERKPITLEQLLQLGIEAYPQKKSHFHKLLGYRLHPRTREKIPCARLEQLNTEALTKLMREREREGVSLSTRKQEIIALRQTVQYCSDLGYGVPILKYPKFLKPKKGRIRFLSMEEAEQFLEELNPRREGNGLAPYENRSPQLKQQMQDAYDLAVLLLYTGARYNEIARLEWSQVDLKRTTIRLYRPKVGNESILQMSEPVAGILTRRYQEGTKYIFQNRKGEARKYATRAFRSAFRRAGIEARHQPAHILRKTFGSWLVQSGVSLQAVSKLLGHSSTQITESLYADLAPNQASKEAARLINQWAQKGTQPRFRVV